VLFPWQVGQLWISGETLATHPSKHIEITVAVQELAEHEETLATHHSKHIEIDSESQWFTEPVRVTREQVRIKAESLEKILAVWNQAQAGRWLESATKPQSKLYQSGPDWMFPIEPQPAPAQTAATTAPVVAASDGPAPLTEPEQTPAKPATAANKLPDEIKPKPWLLVNPQDPAPAQSWYTPARYFARQLVIADSTLLIKKLVLSDKVSKSLTGAGIFKRGGKKPLLADTVLKAFANVNLG
jgi:hypothetical protein